MASVRVVAWDIRGGHDRVSLGTFDSVQVTGNLLRDDEDHELATMMPNDCWVIGKKHWTDLTFEVVADSPQGRNPKVYRDA